MALERADTVYLRNGLTVDSGAGIDIRHLDAAQGAANDDTQIARYTHAQDNVERTFNPGTTETTSRNATALQRLGWAYQVSEMTPDDDANCNAVLAAQAVSCRAVATLTHTATGIDTGGTQSITFRVSLWRYDPATDAAALIASNSGGATTWTTFIGGDEGTFKEVIVAVTIPETEFQPGEVLMVQWGCNSGTLSNPTSGTTTYDVAFRTDAAGTASRIGFSTGVRQRCRASGACAVGLAAGFSRLADHAREFAATVTLAGSYSRQLTLGRSFAATVELAGSAARRLTLFRTFTTATDMVASTGRLIRPTPRIGELTLNGTRQPWLVKLRRGDLAASVDLAATFAKLLRKAAAASVDLAATYSRHLLFVRAVTSAVSMGARLFVKIGQDILNRMQGGATTVVRKIITIFDD